MRLQKAIKAWFDLPGDEDGAKFEIKHLRAGEISEIVAKTHTRKYEFRENKDGELKLTPVLETNEMLERELTIAGVVTNWENIFDETNEVLECSKEGVTRLCKELGEEDFKAFCDFITECRGELAETIKAQVDAERKN